MNLLLVGHGYVASEFLRHACEQGHSVEVSTHGTAIGRIKEQTERFDAVVNCAAYIKNGQVDQNEDNKADTVIGNLVFPALLATACGDTFTPLLHVSTACLYNGHKDGHGWTEEDPPQLSWRVRSDCGTYVAAKQLAEEQVSMYCDAWIARIRLPFDRYNHTRNFISKLRNYDKVYDNLNSLAHRGEFVDACLQMIKKRVPYGIYNVVNQGAIWAHDICDMMNRIPALQKKFVYWDEDEFMSKVARTPKSNCTISCNKLLDAGIHMRPVGEAVEQSLRDWVHNV